MTSTAPEERASSAIAPPASVKEETTMTGSGW
jgi:hypothetical protein